MDTKVPTESPPVDPVMEKPWETRLRMKRMYVFSGSNYQPLPLEPVPSVRRRLAGNGMSDEERMLRRQWLKDQKISPNEPVEIAELRPRHIIRRIYGKPWDVLFNALRPVLGKERATLGRMLIPKLVAGVLFGYYTLYHLKYHHNDWTTKRGFSFFQSKPYLLYPDQEIVERDKTDFSDRDFKLRKSLIDYETSFVPNEERKK